MPNLREISPLLSGKESKTMDESMELSEKVQKRVEDLIDEAKSLIDAEGLDGDDWISDYISGEEEESEPGDMEAKKKLIVLALQKKNGMSSDE